jgi:divalent metal cation (Fe/Co/Zn/Cd) transporter
MSGPEPGPVLEQATRQRLLRRAHLLLYLTVAWNVVEGLVAVASGVVAGSIALVGFGLDSFIEVFAASVLIWRLRYEGEGAEKAERRALFLIGVTFWLLAAYIVVEAGSGLARAEEPAASLAGIVLSLVSLAVMPFLGLTKRSCGMRLRSPALVAESKETLACSYLSLTLFIGLFFNAALGWWWADPAAALAMVPWVAREGWEGVRGEED